MKRGQVTIYIILGIVLISIIAGSIFLLNRFAEINTDKENREQVTQSDKETVNTYVMNCFSNLTEKTINLIYSNGGYVTIPEELKLNYHNLNLTCLN